MDWKHPMAERHHISDPDLTRYHFDAIRGSELAMVEEHLLWCLHCAHREEESCAAFGLKRAATMNHISTDVQERFHLGRLSDAQAVTEIE